MWQKQQKRRYHRIIKRLLFGRRRFLQLAFALLCLLTVLAIIVAFSSNLRTGFNGHGWDDKSSFDSQQSRRWQNADIDGTIEQLDNALANNGDGANGNNNLPVPSECCKCVDGWRGHFVPAEAEARVFQSVRREHIELLGKLNEAQAKMDAIESKMGEKEAELAKLVQHVEELKLLHKEYSDSRAVRVHLPHSPPKGRPRKQTQFEEDQLREEDSQFDFSRCPITVPSMPLFVFPPLSSLNSTSSASSVLATQFHRQFVLGQQIASITTNPTNACLLITIIDGGDGRQMADENGTEITTQRETAKEAFQHHFAAAGGKNHLVLDLRGQLSIADRAQLGSAVLITPRPAEHMTMDHRGPPLQLRRLIFPLFLEVPSPSALRWHDLPPLLPVVRKFFVRLVANPSLLNRRQMNDFAQLKKSMDSSRDSHLVDLECPMHLTQQQQHNSSSSTLASADHLCYSTADRLRMGRQSVFTILPFTDLPSFQQLFYESLLTGSVPVLCSHRPAALPFARLIDWRLATVQIAADRFPELHFILRAIPLADLVELKRKGRFFFEQYLADTKVVVDAILSAMRVLLQLPGGEQPEPETVPLYRSNSSRNNLSSLAAAAFPTFLSTLTKPPYDDEYLGPIELPFESPAYEHNFTALSLYSAKIWNNFPMLVGVSPRFLPFPHFLPSDSEFGEDTAFGMRPILPGSGQPFALALGGNRPREQFTIIILAYSREQVLLNTLERLNNLPYLNRVLVIWNDVHRMPSIPAWPRLHVPVLFVNGTRNSLNNRFIPYKEIETEAILSMDDDMDIKQFEIVFAFRVWREHRDRIVGFPARFHARFGDDTFYNSNHTCQYSMILTGAAFLHKFYLHAYTYHMPEVIRQKVDEWMNCEDLAMNFLVSHLTRKAPIKTTSKWTLRCPTCPEMLSKDESHFVERHQCIRFFTRVYGYNPLVFTQFRADSVLFKTRVPHNHQKCFRYV